MLGVEPREPLPKIDRHETLWDVWDAALLPALQSSPCVVTFAGGRDSSGMLAAAVDTARRHGLPDPVPMTLRLRSGPMAEEIAWQEEVIRFLGLKEWERVDVEDDLNLVGPIAQTALRRHGHLFPASAFMLLPMLERSRGGTLVVAQGGEEIYVYWRWQRLMDLLALRARPRRSDLPLVALALSPVPLRRRLAMRAAPPAPYPWLRKDAAAEISRIFASEVGTEPMRYDAAVRSLMRHRCMSATLRSVDALADGAGAKLLMPMLDMRMLSVFARDGGWTGYGDQSTTLRKLVGDRLPDSVYARRDKARFNTLFFGTHTRAFAERWSGGGPDPSLVDVDVLRRMWLGDEHDWRTALLMQSAWLHDELGQSHPQGRSPDGEAQHAATA